MKYGLILLAALTLSACKSVPMSQMQADRLGDGYPPEYKEGFINGCDSGYSAAGNIYIKPVKDVTRYIEDAKYKTGWDDGFSHCKGMSEAYRL